ncbi:hypothetical protein EW146_g9544 [Bondarzewia mesenterica]|uniref:Uncharacterized protein n=1 Tax=Bondarzewia mesenterica TaxID=1095465 RepID=A0A4S4L5J6_9AGAM|nr:hypothetical protein EW146_g9544 [Bondarzewia mesenterica]
MARHTFLQLPAQGLSRTVTSSAPTRLGVVSLVRAVGGGGTRSKTRPTPGRASRTIRVNLLDIRVPDKELDANTCVDPEFTKAVHSLTY